MLLKSTLGSFPLFLILLSNRTLAFAPSRSVARPVPHKSSLLYQQASAFPRFPKRRTSRNTSETNSSNNIQLCGVRLRDHFVSIFRLCNPRKIHAKAIKFLASFMLVFFATWFSSASVSHAVTGGRMGGSFKSSGRSTSSRLYSSPTRYSGSRTGSSCSPYYHSRNRCSPSFSTGTHHVIVQERFSAPPRPLSLQEKVIVGGTGVLVAYGYYDGIKKDREANSSTTTVASLTLCLDVSDMDNKNSIISKLRAISRNIDTSRRESVQTLVGDVILELLRERSSISGAASSVQVFSSPTEAQRDFQRLSIEGRSKFDRESVNNFGKELPLLNGETTSSSNQGDGQYLSRPTKAVVTINVILEGDSLKIRPVKFRSDLEWSLMSLSQNAQVGDRLLSAEVLWAPESGSSEVLTERDIYEQYPNLIPL